MFQRMELFVSNFMMYEKEVCHNIYSGNKTLKTATDQSESRTVTNL